MRKVLTRLFTWLNSGKTGIVYKAWIVFAILFLVSIVAGIFGAGESPDFWYWFLLISLSSTIGGIVLLVWINSIFKILK